MIRVTLTALTLLLSGAAFAADPPAPAAGDAPSREAKAEAAKLKAGLAEFYASAQ